MSSESVTGFTKYKSVPDKAKPAGTDREYDFKVIQPWLL